MEPRDFGRRKDPARTCPSVPMNVFSSSPSHVDCYDPVLAYSILKVDRHAVLARLHRSLHIPARLRTAYISKSRQQRRQIIQRSRGGKAVSEQYREAGGARQFQSNPHFSTTDFIFFWRASDIKCSLSLTAMHFGSALSCPSTTLSVARRAMSLNCSLSILLLFR
jgi:hypothetical protein